MGRKKAVRMTERCVLEGKEYGALDDRESKDISNQLMAYCKDFIRSLSSVSLCSICCPFNKYYVEDANSSPKISLEKDENIIKKAMNYVSNDENRIGVNLFISVKIYLGLLASLPP